VVQGRSQAASQVPLAVHFRSQVARWPLSCLGDAQERLRESWMDGLECALDLHADLAIALLRAQQRLALQPPMPAVPVHPSSMPGTAQGTPC